MASRKEQKEQARARRLEQERALAAQARRRRQMSTLGGLVVVVAAIIAVVVAISASGASKPPPRPDSPAARQAATAVKGLLAGIPQSGNTLGSPSAKVTFTEFGDLKCPYCRLFTLTAENQLINQDVRSGRVKLVYRSLCTATCNGPQPQIFPTQQAAAYAAGLQNKAWNYIELFYHLQQDETTSYVNSSFLDGLAKLIPGLNFNQWSKDRTSPSLVAKVTADGKLASALGFSGTPSILVQGPKGRREVTEVGTYSTYESAVKAVE